MKSKVMITSIVLLAVSVLSKGQDETTVAADAPEAETTVAAEPPAEGETTVAAEPPAEGETTASPEGETAAPVAPAVGGCVVAVDETQKDIVHPNLNSWREALNAKKDSIKADMQPEETDDTSTIALKGRFKAQMTQVENMMAEDKLMSNPNQMDIAYTMAKVESVLNTIGRSLYGINWRTKGCGAGFVLTNECGFVKKKE